MTYHAFLMTMSRLANGKKAAIVIQDHPIEIDATDHRWVLSTPVFHADGPIPEHVHSCLSSSGTFHWQSQGAYLKLDLQSDTVLLLQEVSIEWGKYLSFRYHIDAFVQCAEQWQEIFEENPVC